ncbi:MAG: TPM domain-containing protein [Bdellovibrionota bacterium]
MAVGEILNKGEEQRLVGLIKKLERKTSGEIRVHIAKKVSRKGVLTDAAIAFHKLGIDKTAQRNGVLIYIAVRDHELACIGDKGIHEKIGDQGWKSIVEQLRLDFSKGDYFAGLHKALENVGEVLASHFPHAGGANTDELPNEISSEKA